MFRFPCSLDTLFDTNNRQCALENRNSLTTHPVYMNKLSIMLGANSLKVSLSFSHMASWLLIQETLLPQIALSIT